MANPDVPRDAKLAIAQDIRRREGCDLDSATKQVRDAVSTAEELLRPDWQCFLFHAFSKVVVSTGFIESV